MPSKRDVTVKALSSNLLQMKFMKRSVLDAQKEDDKELYQNDAEHWVVDPQFSKQHKHDVNMQPSLAMCEDLTFGRMSFKGFNPAIEKLMRVMNGEEPEEEVATAEDEQFAQQYASVVHIANKFATKKQRGDNHESKHHHVNSKANRFKPEKKKNKKGSKR